MCAHWGTQHQEPRGVREDDLVMTALKCTFRRLQYTRDLLLAVDRRSSAIIVCDCVLLAIQCTIAQPVKLYSMAHPQSVHLCHPHPYTALGPLLPGDQAS